MPTGIQPDNQPDNQPAVADIAPCIAPHSMEPVPRRSSRKTKGKPPTWLCSDTWEVSQGEEKE